MDKEEFNKKFLNKTARLKGDLDCTLRACTSRNYIDFTMNLMARVKKASQIKIVGAINNEGKVAFELSCVDYANLGTIPAMYYAKWDDIYNLATDPE